MSGLAFDPADSLRQIGEIVGLRAADAREPSNTRNAASPRNPAGVGATLRAHIKLRCARRLSSDARAASSPARGRLEPSYRSDAKHVNTKTL